MRIVIAGAGDVGFHLAKLLAYEKQDIVLIDANADKLTYAAHHLDVATITGSSTSYAVLEEAQVARADLLIAVTSSEENNIATAILAKHLGAQKTVARIINVEFLLEKQRADLKTLGIDEIISPETLAAREIKRLLKEAALTDTFDFSKGSLSLIGVSIDEDSPLHNKTLIEAAKLNPGIPFVTIAILRDNTTIIPYGATRFRSNDHAYFVTSPEGIDRVMTISGKQRIEIKHVMILGGSKVGYNAARLLTQDQKYHVKLIEQDKAKCFELAEKLPEALIINGDGRDVELLKEEGIDTMDAFIAVTGNSETNIISSLVAKNHGVAKTIALVENMDYIHLSQKIGVDTMINKKLIAANFIFRYVRKGEIVSITSIHGVDAEILEFEVQPGSKITKSELRSLNFPKTAIIGGVIRDGFGYAALGSFRFEPNDHAVVLSLPESIHEVETFFK